MADGTIVAFALTVPDAIQFYTRHNVAWLPEMRQKYPRKVNDINEAMLSPIEEMMLSFHSEDEANNSLPVCLTSDHLSTTPTTSNSENPAALAWGTIKINVAASHQNDGSVTKRLAMLALACLRASGTIRAFSEVSFFFKN